MVGLLILKHMFALSEEGVCERWVYDPYFQYFTGEELMVDPKRLPGEAAPPSIQHTFPHERSGLTHWRGRIGDKFDLLLQESLRVAHDSGALKMSDLARITVDTTVQPKNVTHHNSPIPIEDANMRLLQRHVQACEVVHDLLLFCDGADLIGLH